MFKKLLPKSTSFFEFFDAHSQLAHEACVQLNTLAEQPEHIDQIADRIKEIERKADDVSRRCIDALHSTFITPFDRSEILRLMRRMDDVIDAVDSLAQRLKVYRITKVRPGMVELSHLLVEAIEAIGQAVRDLAHLNQRGAEIRKSCLVVYEAESRADALLSTALVNLFDEEKDPLLVIKWKEIFERLERATDRCQDTAHIIAGIVIEAS